jgi:nucleotidyltransferase substrate binding protein (TIGR01987 family)
MERKDVRWVQRLDSYQKALVWLKEAVDLSQQRELSNLERQGLIKAFEFTHELAWNLMKDFLEFQGASGLMGSRDATRESFKNGIIVQGEVWMDMIRSRNLSAHTYNVATSKALEQLVKTSYAPLFLAFSDRMNDLKHEHFS